MKKFFVFLLCLAFSFTIEAEIINVPQDYADIQEGISNSTIGDTVLVDTGRYVENINFNGKNITVASLFLTTQDTNYISQTIIDGNQVDNVVEFTGGEDTTAILCGFTITNGASSVGWEGGGIYCYQSNPRLENLYITENHIDESNRGGGINCWFDASPIIENVVIENNSAGKGGGLFCNDYCSPQLRNVTIENNSTLGYYGDGGGICLMSNCKPFLKNVKISNNSLSPAGWSRGAGMACFNYSHAVLQNVTIAENNSEGDNSKGGGIYASYSNPGLEGVVIKNNILTGDNTEGGGIFHQYQNQSGAKTNPWERIPNFYLKNVTVENNFATLRGGGIYLGLHSSPNFENVDIIDNKVEGFESGGGGIYCNGNSSPDFKNVLIKSNQVTDFSGNGGGIYCTGNSILNLENVTISYNNAFSGGGIFNDEEAEIVFSVDSLCNIYYNNVGNASKSNGTDIFSNNFIEVRLDTFSVINPTEYYAAPLDNFSFNIMHGKFEQVNADLYVSPTGDNSNTGLTPDNPLKTINFAIYIMSADSTSTNTIHLADGTYSPTNNNETFPLFPKNYISIIGNSQENVIIDAEAGSNVFYCNNLNDLSLNNLTITGGTTNGNGAGIYCHNSILDIDDITISANVAELAGGGIYCNNSSVTMNNLDIIGNAATSFGGGMYIKDCDMETGNLFISNNTSEYGGAIYCHSMDTNLANMTILENTTSQLGTVYLNESNASLYNMLLRDNVSLVGATVCAWNSNPTLVNLTISNNSNNTGSAIFGQGSNLNLFNTITTSNSGNFGGIFINSGDAVLQYCNFYNNENINYYNCSPGTGCIEADPLFADTLVGDYTLTDNSPCVDTGTPDTTGLNLPLSDLEGNVRIWDGNGDGIDRIDMGAYEYDAPVYAVQNPEIDENKVIFNYPNPTGEYTIFKYSLKQNARVTLKIYNVKGQLVKTLVDEHKQNGTHSFRYDTESLAPAIYFYRFQSKDFSYTRKMLIVK
ncbi:MAG: T9SS type A sorting domain-containing protein [Candidatus Cloacimonetes bacterium]|nr:T9SS type A sorting domain-containing protein [Candidatus Cloacimonadota bacterium]MBS3768213.1 T9SS type A sorting domain-containing protein [Candidatus Cloacimonadota bacterium]